ncbi:MAG: tryptophan synthase subunit alpha [Desulfomonilaceae bacterium]
MSSRITSQFEKAASQNRAAYIPFLMGSFPDERTFVRLLKTLDDCSADVIEVGVPFSDPLADGPTIQKAGKIALDRGASLRKILGTLGELNGSIRAPIVLMTYWNPILRMGLEQFGELAKVANIAGTIIPDLPPEEAGHWINIARSKEIDTIFMVAPTTTPERLQNIVSLSSGFIYVVSMTGVTGSALVVNDNLLKIVTDVKRLTSVPVAVGFGVSNPEQARTLSNVADGVIVGSALIKKCLESSDESGASDGIKGLSLGIISALGKDQ